jgi:hypothetical protein
MQLLEGEVYILQSVVYLVGVYNIRRVYMRSREDFKKDSNANAYNGKKSQKQYNIESEPLRTEVLPKIEVYDIEIIRPSILSKGSVVRIVRRE